MMGIIWRIKSSFLFLLCISQYSATLSELPLLTNLRNLAMINKEQNPRPTRPPPSIASAVPNPDDYGGITLMLIGLTSQLIAIYNVLSSRVLPQPTTALDTLEIVKRLENLARPNDEEQYKPIENSIARALNDLESESTTENDVPSEIQILWWLERARWIDTEIILLIDGLLGKLVAGVDLMKNIKENLKCNATLIAAKVKTYSNLINDGSKAFNRFANRGEMSELEFLRRKSIFKQRAMEVGTRIENVIAECYQEQLKEKIKDDPEASTEKVATKVAQALSFLYPLPTRWIVGVYRDEREQLQQMGLSSRASVMPIKPKLSAAYNIKNISGYNVALFPFPDGSKPKMINGRFVDVFCNRPVIGAGAKPTCDVGSSDGEYIFDELRRLGIVPNPLNLIVVPSGGQLSVKTVPSESFPTFFSKSYPDFDIIVF